MICYWYEAPSYLFFAPDLPGLLYYSHIPGMIIALLVGTIVLVNNPKALLNRLLFLLSLVFSVWILINLVAWTNIHSGTLLFFWSFYGILQALISVICVYLMYVFITGKDVSLRVKGIFLLLLLPAFLFAPTDLHIGGLDLAWCDAFKFEGIVYKTYYTALGILAALWIFVLLVKHYRVAAVEQRKQMLYLGIGIELFLISFFSMLYVGGWLTLWGWYDDSRIEFYGLFSMTILMTLIGVIIVRFKAFNVGIHASTALIIALLVLTASKYTFASSYTDIILTTITLVLVALAGYLLIKSVKKEVEQRKQIEGLAHKLEKANVRLKKLDKLKSEFVSIASHQLRSPLTSIRGYAAMLTEGSFGNIPEKAREPLQRIEQSAQNMALSIEDYLNVSRIESGNMKYNYTDFNLKEMAEQVTDDIRPQATKKGLVLSFKSDLNSKGIVSADPGKTQQILHNIINNALKYTPNGSITVFAHDDTKKKKMYIEVIDTGVGMEPKTIEHLFDKFERAKNANSVNASGAGLGLFVARSMARAMKGDVIAHSEGEGKGSHFILELPLQM